MKGVREMWYPVKPGRMPTLGLFSAEIRRISSLLDNYLFLKNVKI